MKRKFTTMTRVFGLFADVFDLNDILRPKFNLYFETMRRGEQKRGQKSVLLLGEFQSSNCHHQIKIVGVEK